MAVSHFSKVFGVQDAKIAALTADPSGGAATYGSLIDVPGVKKVTLSGTVTTKQLRGDNQLLDQESVLGDVKVAFEYAKLSVDLLPGILGGTTTDSGTGTTEVATYRLLGTDDIPYFKFEAQVATADTVGGDIHIVLYKVKLDAFPDLGFEEEDYKTHSASGIAVPRLADNRWVDVVINETAAAIA